MSRLSYDSVNVLIYDPVPSNRTATRATLYALGFRLTESVSSLDQMMEKIHTAPPDIVLCEAQGAAEELCAAIQQMRQGGAGYNPFIVIIVTAWEKSAALISKVVSSGADDLLLRPFSTAMLAARIESHIDRRKGFVITTDYVGPDRRTDACRASNVELFDPPNSLKMKAKDKLSADVIAKRLDAELKTAREKLVGEKLRRDTFQVCILWRMLQEQIIAPGAMPPDLAKLMALTRSIQLRAQEGAKNGEFPAAPAWCESVLAAAEGLHLGVDRNASLHLLGHGALSLHQVFHPEKGAADQMSEIDATLAIIRARTQAHALAS